MLYTSNTFVNYNHPVDKADVVFLGIPSSIGSLSTKSNYAPVLVRHELKLMEDYTEKGSLFEKLNICDIGDLEVSPLYKETEKRIIDTLESIKDNNQFFIFVGGNHLITLPITKYLRPKTIVQLDAHADIRKEYLGKRYMQQTWAYHALKTFAPKIIQIGCRSLNKQESEAMKDFNIQSVSYDQFFELDKLEPPVYLTIDIDVFDPCYVKTGLPEPNGLTPKQAFDIMDNLPDIQAMDLVEISDNKLPSPTACLAARLIKKALTNWL